MRRPLSSGVLLCAAVLLSAWALWDARPAVPDEGGYTETPSSQYLALLPDGEEKRRFILDCTGCHVWTEDWVRGPGGFPRSGQEWSSSVGKMLGLFGQGSGFPIISSWPDPDDLGREGVVRLGRAITRWSRRSVRAGEDGRGGHGRRTPSATTPR